MEIKEFIEKFGEAIEVDDVDTLTPETEFHLLDEWSSISVMLTIAFFDEEFGKEISAADLKSMKTIQDVYDFAMI